jgi:hypothetical protein
MEGSIPLTARSEQLNLPVDENKKLNGINERYFRETDLTIKILFGLYNVFSRTEFVYGNDKISVQEKDRNISQMRLDLRFSQP